MFLSFDELQMLIVHGTPTPDQFREYCLQVEQRSTVPFVPMEHFFKDSDLDQYWQAKAWWPKDAPPRFQLPELSVIALARQQHTFTPFIDYLNTVGAKCGQWLQSEGRDLQNANETPEERKARKARESAQRHRDRTVHKAGPEAKQAAQALQALYEEYKALCQERRTVEAEFKGRISTKWAEYAAAKADYHERFPSAEVKNPPG